MLSLKTKNEFLQLINSNYTCLDFLRFVQDNYEAQTIISRYYDEDYVRKLVWFLESHDDCEIESILNTNHTEYYDPDYGSSDPLSGYRIGNKKDVEDFSEYLKEGDDPLIWIARAIEEDKEELESNLEEMLEFINGIPSILGLRIGVNKHVAYINSLLHKVPNTSKYEFPIKFSYAIIDCERDKYETDTITSLSIYIPFNICTQELINELYEYISDNLPYNNHSASYSCDTSDKLTAVNIEITNSLYNITMDNYEYPLFGKSLRIKISPNRIKLDLEIYRAFEAIMTIKGYEKLVWETLYSFIPEKYKE